MIHNPKYGILVKHKKNSKKDVNEPPKVPCVKLELQADETQNQCLIQDCLIECLKDVLNSFNFIDLNSYQILDDI